MIVDCPNYLKVVAPQDTTSCFCLIMLEQISFGFIGRIRSTAIGIRPGKQLTRWEFSSWEYLAVVQCAVGDGKLIAGCGSRTDRAHQEYQCRLILTTTEDTAGIILARKNPRCVRIQAFQKRRPWAT
jgi:hypothetical protein